MDTTTTAMAASTLRTLLTLLGLSLVFTSFKVYRDPAAGPTRGAPVAVWPSTTNSTAATGVDTGAGPGVDRLNTTSLCVRACGPPPAACNQSLSSGIVYACARCTNASYTAVGASCVRDVCQARPWCASARVPTLLVLHRSLVTVQAEGVVNITKSANWTALAPYFTPGAAARALQQLERARASSLVLPTIFFDDEAGWWARSLVAYDAVVPVDHHPYLHTLKQTACTTQHWRLNLTSGLCVAP